MAASETLGGSPASVGPAVINDPRGRARHQLDVVALGPEHAGTTRVLAIGEAKHSARRLTISDLDRLVTIRRLIGEKHPTAAEAKLLVFPAKGFDRNLTDAAAARPDVELIDLERSDVSERIAEILHQEFRRIALLVDAGPLYALESVRGRRSNSRLSSSNWNDPDTPESLANIGAAWHDTGRQSCSGSKWRGGADGA